MFKQRCVPAGDGISQTSQVFVKDLLDCEKLNIKIISHFIFILHFSFNEKILYIQLLNNVYLKEYHGQVVIFPTEDGQFDLESYDDHHNFEVISNGGNLGNFNFRTPASQLSPIPAATASSGNAITLQPLAG